MSEIFKKLLRRRRHGGLVKPGEPFSFFLPKEFDEPMFPGVRCRERTLPQTVVKKKVGLD